MIRTRVGYAGGEKRNPTYYSLGNHTETLQIDYDPEKVSYKDLLDVFWKSHNPARSAGSRQYMAAVFFDGEKQKELAGASKAAVADRTKAKIETRILPLNAFYRAEDYHQKYMLRRSKTLITAFQDIYPTTQGLVDSTAAARVNGYLGGHGGCAMLKEEIHELGLSEDASRFLLRSVCRES